MNDLSNLLKIRRVIALGFFDGVHSGHGRLLAAATERAVTLGAIPAAITFDDLPKLAGEKLINTVSERRWLMKQYYGIENLIELHAGDGFLDMSPSDFIELMVREHGAAHLLAGENFRFGKTGAGDTTLLKTLCAEKHIGCTVMPIEMMAGAAVSSSRIRACISEGDVLEASRLLGHPHIISGRVTPGNKIGRNLGAPTINTPLSERIVAPARGVYISRTILPDSVAYESISNFGVHPTVGKEDAITAPILETHLLNKNVSLYNENVIVELLKRVRPEKRFDNLTALREAIAQDIATAEAFFK